MTYLSACSATVSSARFPLVSMIESSSIVMYVFCGPVAKLTFSVSLSTSDCGSIICITVRLVWENVVLSAKARVSADMLGEL